MILKEEIKDYPEKGFWWEKLGIPNSVEAFYQRNKVLQIKDQKNLDDRRKAMFFERNNS